ncbi:aminotransferase class I/II-fold pyridoxal phosphate-dependent enzyme [Catellatospora bangladeshensis]|uniref:aminotransferase class I/II-fold pyridoxal phosphate-dependent enzyme n=1 Tax=Catellatospora bangladeshensis TaxID=310355 RepID=UPI00361A4470
MVLSLSGTKMAHASGIRSIMEDIATSMRGASTGSLLNLSIGNPAPIPEVVGTWRRLFDETLDASFARASCLYGPSRGTDDLVAAIVEYFSGRYGWPLTPEHVVVGSGSQMLSFVASAVFTGPGAARDTKTVLPALPDYTGYQGVYLFPGGVAGIAPRIELCGDRRFRYHLDPDALRRSDDIGLLLLSSPSNPTGRCVSPQELDALLEIAADRDVPIFFDHAYGAPFPQIVETPEPPRWHENIINVFTVSKAGLPGERIGFAVGDPRFIEPMVSFVANSTLHAGQLAQQVTARALATGELDRLTAEVIRPYYAHKRRLGEAAGGHPAGRRELAAARRHVRRHVLLGMGGRAVVRRPRPLRPREGEGRVPGARPALLHRGGRPGRLRPPRRPLLPDQPQRRRAGAHRGPGTHRRRPRRAARRGVSAGSAA